MTPDKFTNQEFMLDVGDGHQLYVQDWGKKDAKTPIIHLHGGPGAGTSDQHKVGFTPQKQRVIFFHQRSSGQSLPHGSLENNTTQDSIEDIEKLVDRLGLEHFIIAGSSWGSCLALAYAIEHPERIKAMVLRGIFTATKSEIDWVKKGDFKIFFPEVWKDYVAATPETHQSDPNAYHMPRILSDDQDAVAESAYVVNNIEGALLNLDDRFTPRDTIDFDPTLARIETHYAVNNYFLSEGHIFNNAHKLTMPIWLIQGRYDMLCPPITAYQLHNKLPNSELIWTVSGHHGSDRGNHDVNRAILLQMADG